MADSYFWRTFSVAKALLTGKDVSKERLQARLEICSKCDLSVRSGNILRCSVCGCRLAESGLVNLARYAEDERYGCKYPDGSKWKDAGV